jgi:hypothetical protein
VSTRRESPEACSYLQFAHVFLADRRTQGITQLATVKRLYPAEQIFRLQKQSIFSSFSNKKKTHAPSSYFREVILVSNYIPFDVEL